MGSGGMNGSLKRFVQDNYTNAKSDLMTCFMHRTPLFILEAGYWA